MILEKLKVYIYNKLVAQYHWFSKSGLQNPGRAVTSLENTKNAFFPYERTQMDIQLLDMLLNPFMS